MKTPKITSLILAMAFTFIGIASCTQKEKAHGHEHGEEGHSHSEGNDNDSNQTEFDLDGISFKDENLKNAFDQYALLRKALTDTDFDKAKSNAITLLSVIEKIDGADKVAAATEVISKSANIDTQRLAFSDLSTELLALVKGNLSSGELYLAHCPMANDNAGANWITEVNEIKNPYFGDKMLKCGTIQETLN
jgi:hypothetical protein